jgi:hypothetical protein
VAAVAFAVVVVMMFPFALVSAFAAASAFAAVAAVTAVAAMLSLAYAAHVFASVTLRSCRGISVRSGYGVGLCCVGLVGLRLVEFSGDGARHDWGARSSTTGS